MKVIVTGSLGHISKPLTEELIQKGNAVTVISSNAERKKDIENIGATAAIGSLEDLDFLKSVFKGSDAVYVMVPPNFSEPDPRAYYNRIGNNYAKAIEASGVKKIVHLSSYGAHLNHGTGLILGSHDVEGILDALPSVAVAHLRPGYFYYNLYSFSGMIKAAGFIGSNYGGDDKMVMVSPKDIAAVAAEEIQNKTEGKKVRYIASDEHSCNEVAQIIGESIGKPGLKWLTFTNEQTQQGLEKNGVPAPMVANIVEMGTATHSGILREEYDKHKPALGKVKLTDFAKEFAAAFNKN